MTTNKRNISTGWIVAAAVFVLILIFGFMRSPSALGGNFNPVNQDVYSLSVNGTPIISHSGGISLTTGTFSSTLSTTGIFTPTGGIAAYTNTAAPTVFHSGGFVPATGSFAVDTTVATNATYISEVYVPLNTTLTGVSLLQGSVATGQVVVALADSTGAIVATATKASSASAAGYQKIPFTSTYTATGPGKYFILVQSDSVGEHFRTHVFGNFGATSKTGETFGTFTSINVPATFTTAVGPVADTY